MQLKSIKKSCAINFIGTISLVTLSCVAQANEPVDWSGQYAGVALGVVAGKVNPTVEATDGNYFNTNNLSDLKSTFSQDFSDNDVSATFIYGYQWQQENWVYGLETNLFVSNFSSKKGENAHVYENTPTISYGYSERVENKFGISIKPKVGYAFDNMLINFSVGPILSKFKYTFNFNDSNSTTDVSSDYSDSKWALGVTTGLDFNYKLENDYVLYASYMYTYYPDVVDGKSALNATNRTWTDEFKHDASFSSHTVSVGLVKYF